MQEQGRTAERQSQRSGKEEHRGRKAGWEASRQKGIEAEGRKGRDTRIAARQKDRRAEGQKAIPKIRIQADG